MRLHHGGGRVDVRAGRSCRGQVNGTGIRHELHWHRRCFQMGAVHRVAICVVAAPELGPLVPRPRVAPALPSTVIVAMAVNLSVVVGLAEVEDLRAASAANPHKFFDKIHARPTTAALLEVAPPGGPRASSPGQRPTRDTRAQGSYPWAFIFRGRDDRLRDREPPPLLGEGAGVAISTDLGDR